MRHLFRVETLTGAAPIGLEKKGWIIIYEKGLLSNGHQFICLILTIHRGLGDVFGLKMGLQVLSKLLDIFLFVIRFQSLLKFLLWTIGCWMSQSTQCLWSVVHFAMFLRIRECHPWHLWQILRVLPCIWNINSERIMRTCPLICFMNFSANNSYFCMNFTECWMLVPQPSLRLSFKCCADRSNFQWYPREEQM